VPIRVAPDALLRISLSGDARVGDPVSGRSGARFDSGCAMTGEAVTTVVFTAAGIVPKPAGAFVTVANPDAGVLIDQLTITLTNQPRAAARTP
jgi:hypothetical protein